MAKGDKKKAFMARTGKTEAEYYEHSKQVCNKRHFNIKISQLLRCYGFDPLEYLDQKSQVFNPEEQQEGQNYLLWLMQDCECPITVLRGYLDNYFNEEHRHSKENHIADLLRAFPEASFRRFGDINQVEPKKFFKVYADDKGMPIDVQAIEISEISGLDITPQDIADFATEFPKGAHTYKPLSWADRLSERYYQLTGMKLTYDFARQIIKMMEQKEMLDLSDTTCPF